MFVTVYRTNGSKNQFAPVKSDHLLKVHFVNVRFDMVAFMLLYLFRIHSIPVT